LYRKTSKLDKLKLYYPKLTFCTEEELDKIFKNHEIESVIHCATNYGYNQIDFTDIIDSNYILPSNILKLSIKYNVKYFINTDSLINKNISLYSLSKTHFKELSKFLSDEINFINLRLDHFYGPGDNQSKFLIKIIHDFLDNKKELDLTLGEQKRRFLYIDDLTIAILLIINNLNLFKNFVQIDITGEKLYSIKEVVLLTKSLCSNHNTKLNWGAIDYRKNEIFEPKANLNTIKNLGWKQNINLEEGIKNTILSNKK
jgi:nucleoside-diphosphate-sugar epimerase